MNTNIMVISTNRADYSHLFMTLKELKKSKLINTTFVATGGHFDRNRGSSLDELYETGIKPDYKIRTVIDWGSEAKLFSSIASFEKRLRTLIKMVKADYIMVLGDRIELLAVINLSLIMGKKIIHISGGETTQGAVDDNVRRMLSLVSSFHFVSGEYFRKSLSDFLKTEKNIFNAGDPILEHIDNVSEIPITEIGKELNINLEKNNYILFTYHPETATDISINDQFSGIKRFLSESEMNVVCTAPNADLGGDYILKQLKHISNENKRVTLANHLGFIKYNSLMKNAFCAMGNSSSLVIECPYLKVPSVLIGNRQKGRPLSDSVISSSHDYEDIKSAYVAVKRNEGAAKKEQCQIHYERAETSLIIRETLERLLC
ncbi:MAG: UDP-N-acetylglucosamine 2-epimerase [bacterium]|nr:UDP-N-acetylglucosamine 2-epimerase [bacterium]